MSKLYDTGLLDVNNYRVEGTAPDTFPVSQLIIAPVVAAPSLDLNFAAVKALDSRITFTRASTGTYINSSGLVATASSNVARFTHDPVTLASLGLLVEESRTNLMLQGNSVGTSPWLTQSSATATTNQATSPDGTTTASSVVLTSNPFSAIYQGNVNSGAGTFTMSVWVKVASGTANFFMGSYSVADGQVFSSQFTATTTWQRFTWTRTVTAISNWYPLFTNTASGGTFLVWGSQLESGSFATSYIPTTTATVTRAADVAAMTGTNFSSWYNQTEGTTVISHQIFNMFTTFNICTINDGTSNNTIEMVRNSNAAAVVVGGVTQASLNSFIPTAGQNLISSLAYKVNDFAACRNGQTVGTDTSGTIPTVNQFLIAPSNVSLSTIARFRYYRLRLTNTNIQTLTK